MLSQQDPTEKIPALELFWRLVAKSRVNKNRLMGQVLTVIDAVIPDKRQNKAVKDMIYFATREDNHDRDEYLGKLVLDFLSKFYPAEYDKLSEIQKREIFEYWNWSAYEQAKTGSGIRDGSDVPVSGNVFDTEIYWGKGEDPNIGDIAS